MSNKDDCISRQAALDAIMGQPPEPHYPSWYAAQIEKLPAVQPATNCCSEIPNGSDDTISRQAAIDALKEAFNPSIANFVKAKIAIDKLPLEQPERKKGRWLRYGEDGYPNNEDTVFWQCDQCLEQYTGRTKRIPNFCPNCGADMREET